MRVLKVLLAASLLAGCANSPGPKEATPVAASTAVEAGIAEQRADWYTFFAPDGTFSVQFPKAPEQVGNKNGNLMVGYPLDKKGSNLSLVQTQVASDFSLAQLRKDPSKLFGKGVQVAKMTPGKVQGRDSADLEVTTGPNRLFIRMVLDAPNLYQLIAFQSATSSEDYSAQRQQFWSSFQFTQKATP